MLGDNQSTIRIRNFNCVNQDVKIFYTQTTGDNGINDITDNILKRKLTMTTSDWGNNFLNSDGNTWVANGVDLPFAFSAALTCELLGSTGGGILTTLTTIVGETIDGFFLRLMEDLATTGGLGKTLANASPMGVHIYYVGTVCYLDLIMYINPFGADYSPQSFEITTSSLFPQTNFQGAGYHFGFKLDHPDGWRPFIEIKSLDIEDASVGGGVQKISGYQIFLESMLNQDLYIDELRKYSTSPDQANEPIKFESFDSDGYEQKITQTNVIDPYQAQPALEDYSDIVLDGQVFGVVTMLAGEFLEIRITYESAGILHYDEILKLEELLEEQGVVLEGKITDQEKKDMEEAYLNFSGFKKNEKKDIGLILLASIAILLLLNN